MPSRALLAGHGQNGTVTVGLICAIPEELQHLDAMLIEPRPQRFAGIDFTSGVLDGRDVVVVGSGMGKVNASVVTTILADRFACDAVVFSGVAGGVDPDLQIGDLVIAEHVIQHDAGLIEGTTIQTYQAGHVPFANPTDELGQRIDPQLLVRVRKQLDGFVLPPLSARAGGTGRKPRITYGTILTGDQYVHSDVFRDRLRRDLAGHAVEMEGGAVAQVAEAFGIPWLLIRGLSDLAGRDSRFDFDEFVHEVAAMSAAVVRQVLPVI